MQAVMQQAMLELRNILGIMPMTTGILEGLTVSHTPEKMARVPKLENPHRAYVAITLDLGCKHKASLPYTRHIL